MRQEEEREYLGYRIVITYTDYSGEDWYDVNIYDPEGSGVHRRGEWPRYHGGSLVGRALIFEDLFGQAKEYVAQYDREAEQELLVTLKEENEQLKAQIIRLEKEKDFLRESLRNNIDRRFR